jgi:hypothetical protein
MSHDLEALNSRMNQTAFPSKIDKRQPLRSARGPSMSARGFGPHENSVAKVARNAPHTKALAIVARMLQGVMIYAT